MISLLKTLELYLKKFFFVQTWRYNRDSTITHISNMSMVQERSIEFILKLYRVFVNYIFIRFGDNYKYSVLPVFLS